MGLDTTRRSSSINSTVAADRTSLVTLKASSLENGIEDLAGSAALVRLKFQRIFAARETSLRCNEPSASRNLALATTGIEVQGSLETTENEGFDDASDFGTPLTLAAPAAGYRDMTSSSCHPSLCLLSNSAWISFSKWAATDALVSEAVDAEAPMLLRAASKATRSLW